MDHILNSRRIYVPRQQESWRTRQLRYERVEETSLLRNAAERNGHPAVRVRWCLLPISPVYSILKFFQVDSTGMFRMTSSARYFKKGVGSSRPNWRWIMCFVECPKANTSCKAWVKCFSFS
jgi:hypothetical protein